MWIFFPWLWYCGRRAKTVKDLIKITNNNPSRLAMWMYHNIWYEKDKTQYGLKEYWARPEETLENKKGDCDDFAILAHAVLSKIGYDPKIVGAFNDNDGHAECVFFDDRYNRWGSIANKGFKKHGDTFNGVGPRLIKNANLWRKYDIYGRELEEYQLIDGEWIRSENK